MQQELWGGSDMGVGGREVGVDTARPMGWVRHRAGDNDREVGVDVDAAGDMQTWAAGRWVRTQQDLWGKLDTGGGAGRITLGGLIYSPKV